MDYEKKYNEALERAKRLHCEPTGGTERIVCEQIFPELKESEDEKIRKELIVEVKEQIDCIPAPDCRDKEDEKALKHLNQCKAWAISTRPAHTLRSGGTTSVSTHGLPQFQYHRLRERQPI